MSDDYSLGDVRQSYSNIGGPAAKHAQTHDVRREQLTNPNGPGPVDTSFAGQMDPGTPWEPGSYEDTNSPPSTTRICTIACRSAQTMSSPATSG